VNLLRNFPIFVELGLLPCSQELLIDRNPEPH